MAEQSVDTVIVGGGISGIYAASLLSQKQLPFVVPAGALRLNHPVCEIRKTPQEDLVSVTFFSKVKETAVRFFSYATVFPYHNDAAACFQNRELVK